MSERRKIYVTIAGPVGEGKTIVANVLRQAFSDDHAVNVTFDESVGLVSDKTMDAIDMEPMDVYVREIVGPSAGVQKNGMVQNGRRVDGHG